MKVIINFEKDKKYIKRNAIVDKMSQRRKKHEDKSKTQKAKNILKIKLGFIPMRCLDFL